MVSLALLDLNAIHYYWSPKNAPKCVLLFLHLLPMMNKVNGNLLKPKLMKCEPYIPLGFTQNGYYCF